MIDVGNGGSLFRGLVDCLVASCFAVARYPYECYSFRRGGGGGGGEGEERMDTLNERVDYTMF